MLDPEIVGLHIAMNDSDTHKKLDEVTRRLIEEGSLLTLTALVKVKDGNAGIQVIIPNKLSYNQRQVLVKAVIEMLLMNEIKDKSGMKLTQY